MTAERPFYRTTSRDSGLHNRFPLFVRSSLCMRERMHNWLIILKSASYVEALVQRLCSCAGQDIFAINISPSQKQTMASKQICDTFSWGHITAKTLTRVATNRKGLFTFIKEYYAFLFYNMPVLFYWTIAISLPKDANSFICLLSDISPQKLW